MAIAPTAEEALQRLRLPDDLLDDVTAAIPQALAEAQDFLDGKLYESEAAKGLDVTGVVVTPAIIAAQLLLIDALVGYNDTADQGVKRKRAFDMLRPSRNMGC